MKSSDHIKAATARKDELKKLILKYVEENGDADAAGHQWLAGDEYLIKRERRVSRGWDEGAATVWAESLGILDSLTTTVVTTTTAIDPDKVAAYAFLHPDLEATVKSFNTESVTWAFPQPVKQKKYEY